MGEYNIRFATEDDCEELSQLKHKVWDETYRGIYPDEKIDNFDYEKNKNTFIKIVNDPEIELYVVEYGGNLVGYMDYGTPYRPFGDYEQEIGLLYLLKKCQGTGLGRKLFNIAYNKIKEKGYKEFFISCNKYNYPAHKFYEKMGGTIIHIDEDNEDKSIPQVKFLYKIDNYVIEDLSIYNASDYAYVNSRAWLESYKGIIDNEYLEKINTNESIKELTEVLKNIVVKDPNTHFLLKVDGKPMGILHVRKPKYDEFQDCGELGAIYLLNAVKGRGYGKILFEKAKEELKKMGYKKMVNGCLDGNPSNEFYKHMGGNFIKKIPFVVKNYGQELVENIYYYSEI